MTSRGRASAKHPSGQAARAAVTWPLILWLCPQLLILLISLLHVPLWLDVPLRMDKLALPQLLVVQITWAVMLFPILLRTWESAAAVIVVSWPMIELAAFTSATPPARWIAAAAYLTLLLLALAIWLRIPRSERARLIAAALATSLTLGGVLLIYLRAEFGPPAAMPSGPDPLSVWFPISSMLQLLGKDSSRAVWIVPCSLLTGGLILPLLRGRSLPRE